MSGNDSDLESAHEAVGQESTQRSGIDEEACSKFWNVYIEEAQKYDEALLEGWREDMAGMLIFSSLYSASLTAFLIESYQTLQENPAATTVVLLQRISEQLAPGSNGAPVTPLTTFHPPAAALACNVVWFLSLALALTCSLLATFVQQWTRDFLHKTTMRPSPARRARIFAFMYFGLREFGMHTFVDIVPVLLHISLLLFFSGLVVFLSTVNKPLTIIMACVTLGLLASYMLLTFLPVLYLQSPYRTPLSSALWQRGGSLRRFFLRRHEMESCPRVSLTEAMLQKSQHHPEERDAKAVNFTMASLTDDDELFPLLEALPDLMYGPNGLRVANLPLIDPLLLSQNPQTNIISRINAFTTKYAAWTIPKLHDQYMNVCYKVLWALGYRLLEDQSLIWKSAFPENGISESFLFDRNVIQMLSSSAFLARDFAISALAVMRLVRGYSCFLIAKAAMTVTSSHDTQELLKRLEVVLKVWTDVDLVPSVSSLAGVHNMIWPMAQLVSERRVPHYSTPPPPLHEAIKTALQSRALPLLERRWKASQIAILSDFLVNSLTLNKYPHRFSLIYNAIFKFPNTDTQMYESSIAEFEDDEVDFMYKPIRLIDGAIEKGELDPVTDEVAKCSLQLFLLTPQACSHHQKAADFRRIMHTYIITRGTSDSMALNDMWDNDGSWSLGTFILYEVLDNTVTGADVTADHVTLCLNATWQLCRLSLQRVPTKNYVSVNSQKLAQKLFGALRAMPKEIDQNPLYQRIKLCVSWMVLQNVGMFVGQKVDEHLLVLRQNRILQGHVPDDQAMDDICSLGRELLPRLFPPEFKISRTPFANSSTLAGDRDLSRSLQEMNHLSTIFQPFRSHFMSVNLILVARLLVIATRDTAETSESECDHHVQLLERIILDFRFYGSMANEESQMEFADSLNNLVITYIEKAESKGPADILRTILGKNHVKFAWDWITSKRCAQILLQTFQKLEDYGDFRDTGISAEDCDFVLDLCMEVIERAVKSELEARTEFFVNKVVNVVDVVDRRDADSTYLHEE
ncbi:hypothetical protein D9758_014523 [Tetrapyrgos nigripes]|uniref:DUF6535 domain-containing protein n=1 Tax=Tetrapyrgos nigripes TaxID=182062 RepID=A0A8H5CUD6_9AGAR|nr:hypothetical protein D9758_014523 [Tetrapyrgos nigripes]